MHYYSDDEKKGQLFAIGATFVYLLLLLSLVLFVNFSVEKSQEEEGIMMDLQGFMGQQSSYVSPSKSHKPAVKSSVVASKNDKILTQNFQEAPVIKEKSRAKSGVVSDKIVKKPVEKERKVNTNALFKKSTAKKSKRSTSTKKDNSSGLGGYSGDNKGTGGGGSDSKYSVGNLKIVGSLPLPSTNYGKNKSGVVVVEVYVNSNGYVTRASAKGLGSTTRDNQLVRVAEEAARKARFTRSGSDALQVGTITYTFKLK